MLPNGGTPCVRTPARWMHGSSTPKPAHTPAAHTSEHKSAGYEQHAAPGSVGRGLVGTPGSALMHRPNATTAEFWLLRAAKAEVRVRPGCLA